MNHIETERKFVIKMPDISLIAGYSSYTISKIEQIYLTSEPHITKRIRRREYGERVEYTKTTKVRISKISAIEDECEITAEEYSTLRMMIKDGSSPVIKERHTVEIDGQLYEIDIYPFWESTAILETELDSEDKELKIPPFFEIIDEVSGRREYTNAALAYSHPDELK